MLKNAAETAKRSQTGVMKVSREAAREAQILSVRRLQQR